MKQRVVVAVGLLVAMGSAQAQQPTPPAPPPAPPAPAPPAPSPAPAQPGVPGQPGAPAQAVGPSVAGPGGQCEIVVTANTDSTHYSSTKLPSGQYNNYIGGGVTGHCPAQSLTLVSDSAEYFGELRMWHLIGRVHYTEPRLTLDSDVATYYMNEERLLSEGNVHAKLPSGTTLDGPRMDYLRAVPPVRPVARMTAPGRPTIFVAERDSTGAPSEPMKVVANTVVMDGDSLVYASGDVVITRTDVLATSDTAAMDSDRQFARLMRTPKITSRGDRPFTLYGTVLDLYGHNRALERVVANGAGKAVSQDATLTADTLLFAMATGRLQRVYAWGPSRSRALNPSYDIIADSLDVRMPDQRMREIRAVRKAYAQSVPDTTKVRTTEHDWLRGDTVFAFFDSTQAPAAARTVASAGHGASDAPEGPAYSSSGTAPKAGGAGAPTTSSKGGAQSGGQKPGPTGGAKPKKTKSGNAKRAAPDSTTRAASGKGTASDGSADQPQLIELEARGNASSFYQMAAKDTTAVGPAINYVRGRDIAVTFTKRQVQQVTVIDQVAGLYLEPRTAAVIDSTRPPPDTTAGKAARPPGASTP